MIVGARLKAASDLAIMTGWNGEAFARTKRMQLLEKYLKPAAEKTPEQGASELRAMIARMAAKQGGV